MHKIVFGFMVCKKRIKGRMALRICYIFNALGLLIFQMHVYCVSAVPFLSSSVYSNCIQVDADLILFFYDPNKLCFNNLTEFLNC